MFTNHSHHDTTNAPNLPELEHRAKRLEDHILDLYRNGQHIAPPAIKRHLDKTLKRDVLLTSIRRGISNLTRDGYLEKTDCLVDGGYGVMVHCWKLKTEQGELF